MEPIEKAATTVVEASIRDDLRRLQAAVPIFRRLLSWQRIFASEQPALLGEALYRTLRLLEVTGDPAGERGYDQLMGWTFGALNAAAELSTQPGRHESRRATCYLFIVAQLHAEPLMRSLSLLSRPVGRLEMLCISAALWQRLRTLSLCTTPLIDPEDEATFALAVKKIPANILFFNSEIIARGEMLLHRILYQN